METTKVIIKKWPNTPGHRVWMPIIIASIALIATIISLYWTRDQYVKNCRPYVWAGNYRVLVPGTNSLIGLPHKLGCRVYNSPAKILQFNVKISLNKEELYSLQLKNLVRYPDEKVEWTSEILKEGFDKLMNIPDSVKSKLHRIISIEYSSLNGGKRYHYKLEQYFWTDINQWEDISEEAD